LRSSIRMFSFIRASFPVKFFLSFFVIQYQKFLTHTRFRSALIFVIVNSSFSEVDLCAIFFLPWNVFKRKKNWCLFTLAVESLKICWCKKCRISLLFFVLWIVET
jgi:hypothetical protein